MEIENNNQEKSSSEFYIVRSTPNRENQFLDAIHKFLSKKEDTGIYAIMKPEMVKGYIFVEAESLTKVVDAFRNIPNSKGVLRSPISFEEIEKYFDKESQRVVVNQRDIVEVIAGPFKGDQGRVTRVVPGKDEIIIEPLHSPVPIPITLSLDDIRVIEIAEENK
ncbi:MAG: transcription elongation factor Spt5 [Nanoarchaeota archaeon]|nr:transcription elongation factor Spt5 [Nanoarchaeota archaeon]